MRGINLMFNLVKCGFNAQVVLITARTELAFEASIKASGAACFLSKPPDMSFQIDPLRKIPKLET
jgi:FixJ family two-component response regulator